MKIGIIGTGKFSNEHAKTIKQIKNLKLVGFFSSQPTRAKMLSVKHNCRGFINLKDFLKAVDIVVIANKNYEHFKYAKEAIVNKKHVIIEKPFAIKKEEIQSLMSLSGKYKVKTISFLEYRYSKAYEELKKKINRKEFGEIINIDFEFFENNPLIGWKKDTKNGGGILLMHLIHYIDIILYIIGKKPLDIKFHTNKDESAVNLVMFYEEFVVTINAGVNCKYFKPNKLTVNGTKKTSTVLDNRILMCEAISNSKISRIKKRTLGYFGYYNKKAKYLKSHKFIDVYEDFIESIKTNTESRVDLKNVRDSLELILNIKNKK